MKGKKLYKEIENRIKLWLDDLEKYNEGPFKLKLEKYDMSVNYVYDYIIHRLNDYYLPHITESGKKQKEEKGGKGFIGLWNFMTGSITPFSYKLPVEAKHTAVSKDIMDVKDKLLRLLKALRDAAAYIGEGKQSGRYRHDKLGALKPAEWYQAAIFELDYYYKFKRKLDKKLSKRRKK